MMAPKSDYTPGIFAMGDAESTDWEFGPGVGFVTSCDLSLEVRY